MSIIGVIAEYNPFHKGHLYHLNTIKKTLKPEGIVVVLSGNFVQRGEPAIFGKWARAEMALLGSADLVIELPVCFSTATAEIFAESAINLLSQTQVINTLSFGIEEYQEKELSYLGKLLSNEPHLFKKYLNEYLKKGLPFPLAREKAIMKYVESNNMNLSTKSICNLLRKPNSILAIEYIKAINKINPKITVFPVLRKGRDYHDRTITDEYVSASGIRRAILSYGLDFDAEFMKNLPDSTLRVIKKETEHCRTPVFFNDFETVILYILRRTPPNKLTAYFDVKEGLENRIAKAAQVCGNLKQLISHIKSRRYPETRIQRILIHVLLDIQKKIVASRAPQYIRVLGFNQRGSNILRKIHRKASIPVITRAAEYKRLNQNAKKMFEKDLLASDIYALAYKDSNLRCALSDFSRKVICLNCRR